MTLESEIGFIIADLDKWKIKHFDDLEESERNKIDKIIENLSFDFT